MCYIYFRKGGDGKNWKDRFVSVGSASWKSKEFNPHHRPSLLLPEVSYSVVVLAFIHNISSLKQRERKQRKLYSEEWALGDDDYEGARGFSVAEKLESARFARSGMVREMKGSDLTVG